MSGCLSAQTFSHPNGAPAPGSIHLLPSGASICATEDGRRLYVFGGNDGTKVLNDVNFLELEKLQWSVLPVHVGWGRKGWMQLMQGLRAHSRQDMKARPVLWGEVPS